MLIQYLLNKQILIYWTPANHFEEHSMSQTRPNQLEELSPRQVANLLNARKILLIDVREPDEYATQRIAGALLCPLSTLDAMALPPDESRRVVFQCGSGKRSALAAQARLAAGAPRAAHLAGGIGAWKVAGLPVMQMDPATGKPVRSTTGGDVTFTDAAGEPARREFA